MRLALGGSCAKRLVAVLLAALLAAGVAGGAGSPASGASVRCGWSGYSYAGVSGAQGVHGIAGTITALADPVVQGGHVAAWVGVGDRYEGPGGADEWLQVGLNSLPGTGNRIYYEFVRPGTPITYAEVGANVPTGQPVSVAVLEMAGRPDTWRVWVGGRPVGDPVLLPGSHGRLTPLATAESWDGGTPACNTYTYHFERLRVALAAGGVWRPFTHARMRRDAGQRVVQSTSGFVASVGAEPAAAPAPAAASVGAAPGTVPAPDHGVHGASP